MVGEGDGPGKTIAPGRLFDVNRQGVIQIVSQMLLAILAKYIMGYFGNFYNILRDNLVKYLAGYSGGIFWQNILWNILVKYMSEYFGKILFIIY